MNVYRFLVSTLQTNPEVRGELRVKEIKILFSKNYEGPLAPQ